ncbi:MAG: LysR family transcriptional regulator [Alphaproteobacteria bacterium]|nr:LysR family transcriptional regulator [Alphaproteobacteria bacterium]MBU1515564.1 LysR family transcriptional regulator [Alphaproteobacteria bacterium]MBU2095562.1 LysR family transcriptional regulator [Alphaproteobacteria bacterium]MBU2150803.1 LysR family transcriptional regulator [Alphaproteobacteria bacterium]MBU2307068.1 LysR family transcriptional regulator [Alphaproteobacteria bacterium]
MDRPDLNALDSFAAIARHRNFRRAAIERGVSASTLSQTLRDLEARMGVRLLNRTTRSVALTDAGAVLLERLQPALAEIGEAVAEARSAQAEPQGALRINAPEPAVELVLAPMVAAFLVAYPQVRLEVTSQTAFIDIVAGGFDAGVRWGESLAQDMVAVSLGPPQRSVVVASPALLARVGAPQHPRDLLDRPCVRVRFPSGAEPPWEFEKDGEPLQISPGGPLVCSSSQMQLRVALDGVCFVQMFDEAARPHVEAGRLVEVLTDWSETFPGPFLYYPSRRTMPSPLRAFVDFLHARRG